MPKTSRISRSPILALLALLLVGIGACKNTEVNHKTTEVEAEQASLPAQTTKKESPPTVKPEPAADLSIDALSKRVIDDGFQSIPLQNDLWTHMFQLEY